MIDVAITTLIKQNGSTGIEVYSGGERVVVAPNPPGKQPSVPKVIYTALGGPRLYCDDGPVGLQKDRYQLDIFAERPTSARAIADAIRIGLDGHSGTTDETKIERIYFPDSGRVQGPEQPVGQPHTAARYTLDLMVDYREQVTI